jgi:hypothetical protein
LAESFVAHPYWELIANMLAGSIAAETDEMLASDEHLERNRAAVAYARKILKMPYVDIEQATAVRAAKAFAEERHAARFNKSA